MLLMQQQELSGVDLDSFIIRVKTDNPGTSANNQFTISTQVAYSYNYDVKTSDGQSFSGVLGGLTITFPSAGTYDIAIKGTFPQILFNGTTDKLKLIDILQWGTNVWFNFANSFQDCTNLINVSATDVPDLSGLTTNGFNAAFRGCGNMTFINMNDWDISSIASVNQTLLDTDALNIKFDNWQIHQIRNFTNFARDIGMSTANYDATLIAWEANLQSVYPSGAGYPAGTYTVNFRGVTYTGGGAAEAARTSLINNYGWSFTDGGPV